VVSVLRGITHATFVFVFAPHQGLNIVIHFHLHAYLVQVKQNRVAMTVWKTRLGTFVVWEFTVIRKRTEPL
jgi:hypothetical protein